MKSIFNYLFGKSKKDALIDRYATVKENLDTAKENLKTISVALEEAVAQKALEVKNISKKKLFNIEHNKTLRNLTWYHSLAMDDEKLYKQGTAMNVTLPDGLHCIMHHVFWDDMQESMNDDRLRLDFFYKGELLMMVELNTSREQVTAKVLDKEDFPHFKNKEIVNETYVKCMSPLVKKFELRWKKYKQEEELSKQEAKQQKKIREERNKNKLNEFLNK